MLDRSVVRLGRAAGNGSAEPKSKWIHNADFSGRSLKMTRVCSILSLALTYSLGLMLSSCGSSATAPPAVAPNSNGLEIKSITGGSVFHSKPSRGSVEQEARASWMAPDAAGQDLLYVANVKTITIYSYPRGKLEGSLRFGYLPHGECVDQKGDVFITNLDNGEVVEYAHASKKPLAVLHSPSADPSGCAIDPTTGNLAVASLGFGSSGSVAIYKHARGNPVTYQNPTFQQYAFCGYDPKGNLFVDGVNADAVFVFAELKKGSSTLKSITLDQSIGWPGGIQWDGHYLAVGDQNAPSVIYQFEIERKRGKKVGTTALGTKVGAVAQFYIAGQELIVPNQCNTSCTGNVLYYPYPAGGAPTKTIAKGIRYPHGAVVSRGAN